MSDDESTFSAMKTAEDFENQWKDSVCIENEATWTMDQLTWKLDKDAELQSICCFISHAAPKWASNLKGITNPATGESPLYHFITDVIMSVAELSNCSVIRTDSQLEVTEEIVENAAAEVIAVDPDFGSKLDPTNPHDLASIYLAIERQIRSVSFNTGRVKIAIIKETREQKKVGPAKIRQDEVCAVEVKPTISTDAGLSSAFYQGCSYMSAMLERAKDREVVYGVATDYQRWVFMKLVRSSSSQLPHMISYTKPIPFVILPNKSLMQSAPIVIAYLFEICGVPTNTDLAESMKVVNAQHEMFCQKLTRGMLAACNIPAKRYQDINVEFAKLA